jgi:Flp pilus assembly protein TadG
MSARREDRDRGAVIVEFALIFPIFIALVFGIISYSVMLNYRQGLSQAASESARAAAIVPSGMAVSEKLTRATNALNDALGANGVTCASGVLKRNGATVGTCVINPRTACPSDATRFCSIVTLDHAYRANPIIGSFPGLGITLPEHITYQAVVEVN